MKEPRHLTKPGASVGCVLAPGIEIRCRSVRLCVNLNPLNPNYLNYHLAKVCAVSYAYLTQICGS